MEGLMKKIEEWKEKMGKKDKNEMERKKEREELNEMLSNLKVAQLEFICKSNEWKSIPRLKKEIVSFTFNRILSSSVSSPQNKENDKPLINSTSNDATLIIKHDSSPIVTPVQSVSSPSTVIPLPSDNLSIASPPQNKENEDHNKDLNKNARTNTVESKTKSNVLERHSLLKDISIDSMQREEEKRGKRLEDFPRGMLSQQDIEIISQRINNLNIHSNDQSSIQSCNVNVVKELEAKYSLLCDERSGITLRYKASIKSIEGPNGEIEDPKIVFEESQRINAEISELKRNPLWKLSVQYQLDQKQKEKSLLTQFIPHQFSGDSSNNQSSDQGFFSNSDSETEMILKLIESLDCEDEVDEDQQEDMMNINANPTVDLLPYQLEGVKWMKGRENVEKKRRGGILGDDMGLGKTIQILNLIASHISTDPSQKTTLIVCTLSTLGHWKDEIRTKFPKLKFEEYYAKKRKSASHLEKLDIVLTTFGTLSSEIPSQEKKKEGGDLFKVNWLRVVLDEAHNIKNHKAITSKAAFLLEAKYRWGMTGTPIQNTVDDLFSLLHFIRAEGCTDHKWWKQTISKGCQSKVAMTRNKAFARLRTILQPVLLRRTKDLKVNGTPILSLPSIEVVQKKIVLAEKEQILYSKVYARAKQMFKKFLQHKEGYLNMLDVLLKVRQVCDHPYLVLQSAFEKSSNSYSELNQKFDQVVSSTEDKEEDQITNDKSQSTLCSLCDDIFDEVFISTGCSHQFCESCLNGLEGFNMEDKSKCNMKCPVEECGSKIILKKGSESSSTMKFYDGDKFEASSKLAFLVESIKGIEKESIDTNENLKSVIFSQFTGYLDLMEVALENAKIKFTRLDGKMSHQKRTSSIELFKTDSSVNVFLVSLKAGGVGLNLTEASRLFLCDPWWNPAIEQQAIDRVYRLGQKRPVKVMRFVVENSVEEKIILLQQNKKMTADAVLSGEAISTKKLTNKDLETLFRD
eukprot:TRINITY_DN3114_c0_g1_i1.p1 TRINITY_DN3114_c0_g1~~TRINITY_DN3114_c0_g1_i1.p1  ORF type:complete len:970 (+),score=386.04 TRINITY_DN3114_c0_g1_i1:89-2998(+)